MGLPAAGGAAALQYLTEVFNRKHIGRSTPATRPASASLDSLYGGYEKRVNDIGSGRSPMPIELAQNTPPEDFNIFDPRNSTDPYGSNSIASSGNPVIDINPNADEAYLAHELGHVASKHTDIGSVVRNLRDNPKLSKALLISMGAAPLAASALEAGDDDMDTSLALAAAASLPTLVDEGLATKNGLAIMNNAGTRATLGQRGKLAGGYLSYLLPAIAAGGLGNFVGNQLDQDIPPS